GLGGPSCALALPPTGAPPAPLARPRVRRQESRVLNLAPRAGTNAKTPVIPSPSTFMSSRAKRGIYPRDSPVGRYFPRPLSALQILGQRPETSLLLTSAAKRSPGARGGTDALDRSGGNGRDRRGRVRAFEEPPRDQLAHRGVGLRAPARLCVPCPLLGNRKERPRGLLEQGLQRHRLRRQRLRFSVRLAWGGLVPDRPEARHPRDRRIHLRVQGSTDHYLHLRVFLPPLLLRRHPDRGQGHGVGD